MRIPEFIARQGRCPSGWFGGLIHRLIALETAPENQRVLDLLDLQPRDHVIEIGFGHGRTLPKTAALVPSGLVAGIDPSPKALQMAMRHNRALIARKKLELTLAPSDHIPYPEGRFDKAFAVHTLYFWARPVDDLREIRRVLKPGGRFVLGFRPRDDETMRNTVPASTHTLYTADQVRAFFEEVGLAPVEMLHQRFSRRLVYFARAHRPATAE